MASSTFTYTAAVGQRVAAAFKGEYAAEYAAAIAANPNLTDKEFVEAVTRRWWKHVTRTWEVRQASDAARVEAERQVRAALEAALADAESNVVVT